MMSTLPPPTRPRWTYPNATPTSSWSISGFPTWTGIDLITRLRPLLTTPILVASARDARTAKVAALEAGADDYIAKPFGAERLMSRVRAILRRPEPPNGEPLRFSA
jgi:two-component system KDP operon response regulator KdpE